MQSIVIGDQWVISSSVLQHRNCSLQDTIQLCCQVSKARADDILCKAHLKLSQTRTTAATGICYLTYVGRCCIEDVDFEQ